MRVRGTLFRKYVLVFVAAIGGMLIVRGTIELYSLSGQRGRRGSPPEGESGSAAVRIEHFIRQIEWQVGWATHPVFIAQEQAAEQRRIGLSFGFCVRSHRSPRSATWMRLARSSFVFRDWVWTR